METLSSSSSSSSPSLPHEKSNYNELFMPQSLHFSDSLKDLKNLRMQLYSAAEYFEVSYSNDDQKEVFLAPSRVANTLKDYTVRALVNTVDHLGAASYKVNDFLDEKVDEVSGTELRVTSIDQTNIEFSEGAIIVLTCDSLEGFIPRSALVIVYFCIALLRKPDIETIRQESQHNELKYQGRSFDNDNTCNDQMRNGYNDCDNIVKTVRATIRDNPPTIRDKPPMRKARSPSPTQRSGTFSFSDKNKVSEKRTVSPLRSRFPLLRSGSFSSRPTTHSSRPTTPNPSRPATPNSSYSNRRYPSEPRKSASVRVQGERDNAKDVEQQPSKSKRLLRALLSRRKSKKDDALYTYLDEY
ncbi:hypothetical protein Sjap_005506 [Stephania japonica]|uniref:Uncharacterized protein n=1 Tax=Stephania japonica TaxID=461633 RepID=A0AAP0K464_9MAGN